MDLSHKPESFLTHMSWHQHTLALVPSLCPRDKETLLYSYSHVMHGFSARLTPCQLSHLERTPAHRGTLRETFGKLFTTHTSKFLGQKRSSGIWPLASYGRDVIIGIIDTGIWPESESFSDHGMLAVPARWKGSVRMAHRLAPHSATRNSLELDRLAKDL